MIDCSITKNYLTEKLRMTKKHNRMCDIDCDDCPLNSKNNGVHTLCKNFESLYPEKAVAIVQQWSNEHPQKTYLSELLKVFPNSSLDENGTPTFCPSLLGFMNAGDCRTNSNCMKCWNQPVEESESK